MPFQYTNRRGHVYHLQSTTGRNGSERFSFTRKLTGKPVDRWPEGYEVRELPKNAQVVLRKKTPSQILPLEKQLTEAALRHQAKLEHFIVEADGNELVIWLPSNDPDELLQRMAGSFGLSSFGFQALRETQIRDAHYTKMMRFVLTDPEKRTFNAQRWCFLGSIDNWRYLVRGGSKPLAELLDKYVQHLGKQSFFDLM